MTDNEIIKALEYCFTNDFGKTNCNKCAFYTATAKCMDDMQNAVIDLINRQNAEIERLNIESETLATQLKGAYEQIHKLNMAKSEAIKEFAERFAKALSEFDMSSVGLPDYDRGYKDCMTAIEDTIDSLVKEMTE